MDPWRRGLPQYVSVCLSFREVSLSTACRARAELEQSSSRASAELGHSITESTALSSGPEEQNPVMMALLRFYNISTVRVGGNSEFEGTLEAGPVDFQQPIETRWLCFGSIAPVSACCLGDDDKHHLHKDGINGALKTKANA